ncbi:epididymal-specific lipocalin-5-like [Dugong dugon]
MEGRILPALLGLCVVLAARAQDAEHQELKQPNFDLIKFSGFWYQIALASKLGRHVTENKWKKVGAMLVQLQGKTLALTSVFDDLKRCVKETDWAWQGAVPGTFTVSRGSGRKQVGELFTDYTTYAILRVTLREGDETQKVMKLYTRSFPNNEETMKKFWEMALASGFLQEEVHLLVPDTTCVNLLLLHLRGPQVRMRTASPLHCPGALALPPRRPGLSLPRKGRLHHRSQLRRNPSQP